MIRATIDTRFLNQYIRMIVPAIRRKFDVESGIEGSIFSDRNSVDEMHILFLSTDDKAQEIYSFIVSKWQFETDPVLLS